MVTPAPFHPILGMGCNHSMTPRGYSEYNSDGNRSTSDAVKQRLGSMLIQKQQAQQQPQQQSMMQVHPTHHPSSSTSSGAMSMSSGAMSMSVVSSLNQSPGLGSSGNEFSDLLDFSLDPNLVPESRDRQDSFSTLFESLASDIANSSTGLASPLTSMASSPASLMRSQSINSPRMVSSFFGTIRTVILCN